MAYLTHIAKTTDGTIQDKDGVDKALEMIIDHHALKGRANDYWKASQILDDPKVLTDIADRSAVAMNKIWKENKKQFNIYKRVKNFTDNQERAKMLSDLARRGIYANVNEAEIFIKSGVVPKEFYSDQSRLNHLTAEENPKAYKTLTNVFNVYKKQKEAEEEVNKNQVRSEVDIAQEGTTEETLTAADEKQEITGAVDTEADVDYSVNPNQSGRSITTEMATTFFNSEPGTLKILRKLHKQYEYDVNELKRKDLPTEKDGSSLGFNTWVNHENGGLQMTKARYKAFESWRIQGSKGTFEDFIKENK